MKIKHATTFIATVSMVALTTLNVAAATAGDLLKLTPGDLAAIKTRKSTMTAVEENGQVVGVKLEYAANPEDFPGLEIRGPEQGWDLSGFTGVEAEISNLGKEPIALSLKISNKEPEKSNTEGLKIPPGETRTIKLKFGFSWGKPASQLDLARIVSLRIFESKPIKDGAFLVKRIRPFPVLDAAAANSQAQLSKPLPAMAAISAVAEEPRPNILFISVDDLRCSIGAYGDKAAKTPALDKLAAEGARFDRNYVNFPICIPSRAALLTGARPERTHQVYGPHVWQKIEGIQPMGKYFSSQGYWTGSIGKIWHWFEGKPDERFDKFDWDYYPPGGIGFAVRPENLKSDGHHAAAFERGEADEADYPDVKMTDAAIAKLGDLALNRSKPFLLMVGYLKPHLPFNAPAKYWDLYGPSELPEPPNPSFPDGAPDYAHNNYNDLATYRSVPPAPQPLDRNFAKNLVHGYYACVSFVDAQIGRLLAALEETGLADDTIVVLWSDHGWHLGDQSLWSKNTNFEMSTRGPLIIRAPGVTQPGSAPSAIAESVDLYPTLVELCGTKPPAILDGQSLVPFLRDPGALPAEDAAYHIVVKWVDAPGKPWKLPIVGRAVRTDRFRLVEWYNGWDKAEVLAREFYDYQTDHNETRNLVGDPARKATIDELSAMISAMRNRFPSSH